MGTVNKEYLSILFKTLNAGSKTKQGEHSACSINHPDVRSGSQGLGRSSVGYKGFNPQ